MDKQEQAQRFAEILLKTTHANHGHLSILELENISETAYSLADYMQAEADKQNHTLEEDPSNFSGIMKAKVDAELYGTGFVRLKIVNNEFLYERLDPKLITLNYVEVKEWQPDWSQAPDK